MKLSIISTTIRGESGYLPYDRLAGKSKFSEVHFVIAADVQSPPFDTTKFKNRIEYVEPAAQRAYYSSEPIGWKKFARRNIALLRAIAEKPDYILTVDDDNIPAEDYFDRWHDVLTTPSRHEVVPVADAEHHWHNYLKTSDAPFEMYPRGYPIPFRDRTTTAVRPAPLDIHPSTIGVFQGISLGDPDIDAKTRIVYSKPMPLSTIAEKNYCLKHVWSPYNTQNTIFAPKLFPLAFTWPHSGRHEDIYASFVWQRFLFNNDMYAHVGDAVNVQDRGKRNMLRDLELEVEGYIHGHTVWEQVNQIRAKEPIPFLEELCRLPHPIIQREREFFQAFIKDLAKVL